MKNLVKIIRTLIASASLLTMLGVTACGNPKDSTTPTPSASEFTATIFSDVHHGDYNYNDFKCTNGLRKLQAIIDETTDSDFYINLGDAVDYLKNGETTFYEQYAAKLQENNITCYLPNVNNYVDGNRIIYNVMGNHEAAYVNKSELADYIPYVEGVGSVYSFQIEDVLFISIDANFERESQSDAPSVLKTATKFIIPEAVRNWVKAEASAKVNETVKGIVWISHIAFKDIENTSRFDLVYDLNQYGLPLTIFEGHTHVQNYDEWYDEEDESKILARIHTLPAVTSGETYKYYNVTFSEGQVKSIQKNTANYIELI